MEVLQFYFTTTTMNVLLLVERLNADDANDAEC
jgi:hypothetical protein